MLTSLRVIFSSIWSASRLCRNIRMHRFSTNMYVRVLSVMRCSDRVSFYIIFQISAAIATTTHMLYHLNSNVLLHAIILTTTRDSLSKVHVRSLTADAIDKIPASILVLLEFGFLLRIFDLLLSDTLSALLFER